MAEAPPECRAVLQIRNRLGLHARAAVRLVKLAERFEAEVAVGKDGHVVNGKSIMAVMTLAAEQWSHIEVTTRGPDAAEALEAIRTLVDARFLEAS